MWFIIIIVSSSMEIQLKLRYETVGGWNWRGVKYSQWKVFSNNAKMCDKLKGCAHEIPLNENDISCELVQNYFIVSLFSHVSIKKIESFGLA